MRRRYRFRLATLLALPAVVAFGLVWVGRPPKKLDYWAIFDGYMKWARDSTEDFREPHDPEAPPFGAKGYTDPYHPDAPCFLKVGYLMSDAGDHGTYSTAALYLKMSFTDRGKALMKHDWSNGNSAASGARPLPEELRAALRAALADMPASARDIPNAKAVAVGFQGPRGWETRVYDSRKLPPALHEALNAADLAWRN